MFEGVRDQKRKGVCGYIFKQILDDFRDQRKMAISYKTIYNEIMRNNGFRGF
jgi:hypothetical protein